MIRGFSVQERKARCARAQKAMAAEGLDLLLLTTEPDLRYFSGFLTRFWESPTRPWFLLVLAKGDPLAVIPSIGEPLMRRSGVKTIRTWSSPNLHDDGITLLSETIRDLVPRGGRIGIPDGHETHVRMPLRDLKRLGNLLDGYELCGDGDIICALRRVKSAAEIEKIAQACRIADRAFARIHEIARVGVALEEVFRQFQRLCLEEGADWVPYLAGGAGRSGYPDIISPASETALADGDVLMLDTGLVWDGYFCDFNRNWWIGSEGKKEVTNAYARLLEACTAAADIATAGSTAEDLFNIMHKVLGGESEAGRLGHGLGMALTEWPSMSPGDKTKLVPGMVLCLEPSLDLGRGTLVHEEVVLVTEKNPRYLSRIAPPRLPVL